VEDAAGSRGNSAEVPSTDLRIKTAAVSLFARFGYAGTSIRDIARDAGITTASMYHFFESKEALLVEIMREGQDTLNLQTKRMLDGVDRPEDRLSLLVTELAGSHGINRTISRVTDGELRAFTPGSAIYLELVANRDTYERLWAEAIEQGIAEGVFRVRDARVARLGLMAMCTGVSEWYRPDGPSPLSDICRALADTALSAVRAERDGRPLTSDDVQVFDLADLVRVGWEPGA
jgi:AcrR family transcriptional regulator